MCGIFAILNMDQNKVDIDVFERMSRSLIHRGPDDSGYAFFELFGDQRTLESKKMIEPNQHKYFQGLLAFGHRRLSIIDLTEAGHQPMCNENGQVWIILNGEIYNYQELTEELKNKGHHFRSKTDTEVILHAYEEWGIECLNHFNGMWAFALWDKESKRLFCSRDRFGIKPFYYYFDGKKFILASEIKAILQDREIKRVPNHDRVYDYLAFGYIDHTESTFFQGIKQLRGAHYLTLDVKGQDLILEIRRYWVLKESEELPDDYPFEKRFLELFEDSIRLHMRSDVPVGTCLSGGLDSSSIVCVSQKYLNSNVHKSFSSCFDDKKYDERKYIEKVIEATNVEPYYVFPDPQKLFDEIEDLIWHQEEPFGSTSVYAQWNVFRLAKEHGVKVILDGQGADELLAGYHPFLGFYLSELIKGFQINYFIKEYQKIRSLYHYSHSWLIGHLMIGLLPLHWTSLVITKVHKKKEKWLTGHPHFKNITDDHKKFKNNLFDRLYQSLMNATLPGLLHYEDRNSMAHSIEARVPFLDYRMVEYIFSLPMDYIIRNGTTKVILRETMKGILPEIVRTRLDKMGFVTPEDIWLKNNLKDHIYEILNSDSFSNRGYFNPKIIREYFEDHCQGKINISSSIWRWVNLELWFRLFIDKNLFNYIERHK